MPAAYHGTADPRHLRPSSSFSPSTFSDILLSLPRYPHPPFLQRYPRRLRPSTACGPGPRLRHLFSRATPARAPSAALAPFLATYSPPPPSERRFLSQHRLRQRCPPPPVSSFVVSHRLWPHVCLTRVRPPTLRHEPHLCFGPSAVYGGAYPRRPPLFLASLAAAASGAATSAPSAFSRSSLLTFHRASSTLHPVLSFDGAALLSTPPKLVHLDVPLRLAAFLTSPHKPPYHALENTERPLDLRQTICTHEWVYIS